MSISKKIRFEVFKRDGFQCAYCGNTPPRVILEVDHIQPKSKKGGDDINNLITSCFECNRGKKNIELDKIPPKLQENLEVLKEKEDQLKEYRRFIQKIERRLKKDIEDINTIYNDQYEKWVFSDHFKENSLTRFFNYLPKHEIEQALKLAINKFYSPTEENSQDAIRYFCGICWKKIRGGSVENKIISLWHKLTEIYERPGSYYHNQDDLEYLKNYSLNDIEYAMNKSLKVERSSNYWKHFTKILVDE